MTDFDPRLFRANDVRGRTDGGLTPAFAEALGRAYGTEVRRAGGRRVAIGRDCRPSGVDLAAALSTGLRAAGVDVCDVGMVPTPVVYFAVHRLGVDGGVAVTGSHNPPGWNGFKLMVGTESLYGARLAALGERMRTGDFATGQGQLEPVDALTPYREFLASGARLGPRALKVVVDAGNGAAGVVVGPLYRSLGLEVIELFCEPDGRFPNHHPDPTVEANLAHLKAEVARTGADLGLGFDGDGDRLGAVDSSGRVAWGDQLLRFFAEGLLEERPGARVVGEVKCSRALFDGIAAAGGEPEMWKVGHSLIKARMKETGALLAGEMSGHFFFADRYLGYDDAVYAGLRLLELVSRGPSLAERLDALPPAYATPELRVSCPDDAKGAVVARAARWFGARYPVNDIDGVRIDFPHGWGLIRASNTQPVLAMRFEADGPEALDACRAEVEAWLRAEAPEVRLGP